MSSKAQKQSIGQKKQLAKDSVDVAARLHIVQGGIENGDWDRLKKLGESSGQFESWIVPKAICTGDDVVIFVRTGLLLRPKLAEPKRKDLQTVTDKLTGQANYSSCIFSVCAVSHPSLTGHLSAK